MAELVTYLHLKPDESPPNIFEQIPRRIVVMIETAVSPEWQSLISNWIVRSGCLYMMAWGIDCSSWDDSVEMASLEEFDFGNIPKKKFVMTTWRANDSLSEVFWYAKNCAAHPTVELECTVLLHITEAERESEILRSYADA